MLQILEFMIEKKIPTMLPEGGPLSNFASRIFVCAVKSCVFWASILTHLTLRPMEWLNPILDVLVAQNLIGRAAQIIGQRLLDYYKS